MMKHILFIAILVLVSGCGSSDSNKKDNGVNTTFDEAIDISEKYESALGDMDDLSSFADGLTPAGNALAQALIDNCEVFESQPSVFINRIELQDRNSRTCPVRFVEISDQSGSSATDSSYSFSIDYEVLDSSLASQVEVLSHNCSTEVSRVGITGNSTTTYRANCSTNTRQYGEFEVSSTTTFTILDDIIEISSEGSILNDGKKMTYSVRPGPAGTVWIINGQEAPQNTSFQYPSLGSAGL